MVQDSMAISANMVRVKKYRMVVYFHTNIIFSQDVLHDSIFFLNLKLVLLDSMATAASLLATAMARPSVMPGRASVSVLQVIMGSTVRKVRNSLQVESL